MEAQSSPELDAAYSAQGTVSAERFRATMADYRRLSEEATRGLDGSRELVFDERSGEHLDVWGTRPGDSRPAVVAIHGGYWRMLSRHDTAFMAKALAERGIATVPIDYTLATEAPMEEIVRQVRSAIRWLHAQGPSVGVDADRLIVVGSSAGAQLAAMTLVGGWSDEFGLGDRPVAGGLLLSGLFDLRPLLDAFPNDWLRLDHARAAAASPLLGPPTATPIVVARAELEASGFHEQSVGFADHWSRIAPVKRRIVPDRNHFDVFLDLADAHSDLFGDLLELVARSADESARTTGPRPEQR